MRRNRAREKKKAELLARREKKKSLETRDESNTKVKNSSSSMTSFNESPAKSNATLKGDENLKVNNKYNELNNEGSKDNILTNSRDISSSEETKTEIAREERAKSKTASDEKEQESVENSNSCCSAMDDLGEGGSDTESKVTTEEETDNADTREEEIAAVERAILSAKQNAAAAEIDHCFGKKKPHIDDKGTEIMANSSHNAKQTGGRNRKRQHTDDVPAKSKIAPLIDLTSSGDEDESLPEQHWVCTACTFENSKMLALACEMCAVPREMASKWAACSSQDDSKQWACSRCTLLNSNSTSICAVCEQHRISNSVAAPISTKSTLIEPQKRKKRRSSGDSERQRQMALWKEDQANKKNAKCSKAGSATLPVLQNNTIDLRALAVARINRQQNQHQTLGHYGRDSTWMPGEFGLSETVRYWDLTQASMGQQHAQAKPGLCSAGHRHLATIKNALNLRQPSVTLKRAQYLVNPSLVRKFDALKARLSGSHKVVYLFHGTGKQNIDSIAKKGFLFQLQHLDLG